MTDKFAALSEGTIVRDALEPALEAGVTLNAAGTTSGTAIDCLRPMEAQVRIDLPATVTSTSNTATLAVQIEASNDSTFPGTSETVVLAKTATISGTDVAQASLVRKLHIYSQKRYLRAKVTLGGTAPVYTGLTIRVVDEHYRVHDGDTA